jgi:hypothetical protein
MRNAGVWKTFISYQAAVANCQEIGHNILPIDIKTYSHLVNQCQYYRPLYSSHLER